MKNYYILPMDCRMAMSIMAPQSVHTVVTSPPYFGLRDYGVDGQIGLEPTPDEFVAAMVEVFRDIKRVLRDDGTVWLNLGDSYSRAAAKGGSGPNSKSTDQGSYGLAQSAKVGSSDGHMLGDKQLIGIPWRVALALQADGWYLRQDIIWHKPNPMPESVRDRCTKAHEYIFLLTKKPKYYFDSQAIKEDAVWAPSKQKKEVERPQGYYKGKYADDGKNTRNDGAFKAIREKRNRRSVWTVSTKPFKGAHFATFPPDLIEPCVLAGCPQYCCDQCGAPIERVFERTAMVIDRSERTHNKGHTRSSGTMVSPASAIHTGWKRTCKCTSGYTSGTVFDPFGGSGTTAVVALRHGRKAILSELNPEYVELAHKRITSGK